MNQTLKFILGLKFSQIAFLLATSAYDFFFLKTVFFFFNLEKAHSFSGIGKLPP